MKKKLITLNLEKQRKQGLYCLLGFWLFSLFINWYEDLDLGILLIIIFSGLSIVHTSVFNALEKVLPLVIKEQSNE